MSKMLSLFCTVTEEDILAVYGSSCPTTQVFLFLPSGTRALNTNLLLSFSPHLSQVMLMILSSACRVLFHAHARGGLPPLLFR